MNKWWRVTMFFVSAAGVGLVVSFLASDRSTEPFYNGKPLSRWFAEAKISQGQLRIQENGGGLIAGFDELGEALLSIGTNAVPYLDAMLSERDSALEQKFKTFLSNQSLFEYSYEPAGIRRLRALIACDKLGTNASPLAPKVGGIAAHDSERYNQTAAVWVLGHLGPGSHVAVSALVDKLRNDKSLKIRILAAQTLKQIGPSAKDAVPQLVRSLNELELRGDAALALGRITTGYPSVVPELMALLDEPDDPHWRFRQSIIFALGDIGPAAKEAISVLHDIRRNDSSRGVRRQAAKALAKIEGTNTEPAR